MGSVDVTIQQPQILQTHKPLDSHFHANQGVLHIIYSLFQTTIRRISHTQMIIQLIVRYHVMHIYDGNTLCRVGLTPGSKAEQKEEEKKKESL